MGKFIPIHTIIVFTEQICIFASGYNYKTIMSTYERKIPFDINCDIKITMEIISGKWKCCLVNKLSNGSKRPSELHKLFPDASPRVINQQLKELESYGIIKKKIFSELPPHSEYSLTEAGKTLLPLIQELERWGASFRPKLKQILDLK